MVLPKLTGVLPSVNIETRNREQLNEMGLADLTFNIRNQIDILIGGDIYPEVMLENIKENVMGSLLA